MAIVHKSVEKYFNRVIVDQGRGTHLFDDRVYIKTVLSELINSQHQPEEYKRTGLARLIDEVHIVVPSTLLNQNTALVDTPGVNDVDVVKFKFVESTL